MACYTNVDIYIYIYIYAKFSRLNSRLGVGVCDAPWSIFINPIILFSMLRKVVILKAFPVDYYIYLS